MNSDYNYMYYYYESNYTESEPDNKLEPSITDVHKDDDNILFCGFKGTTTEVMLLKSHLCFIMPCLAVLGIGLNIICTKVLYTDGLYKTCNIFLFALVLADSINILRYLNYGDLLFRFGPGDCYYTYGLSVTMFLFVSDRCTIFMGGLGRTVNATIPMVITVERFLAVYSPMTFKLVVTKKSAIIVCLCIYVFWLPWSLLLATLLRLQEILLDDEHVVFIEMTAFDEYFEFIYYLQQTVYGMFLAWIPNTFVCIGCILVAVKVKYTLRNRRKIARNKQVKWSPKTTRTLLSTCFVFVITHTISAGIYYSLFDSIFNIDRWRVKTMYVICIAEFFDFLNCISNFFIYLVSNKNLYLIVKQMFHRK